ncbi:MAG: hypothetical protein AB2A00_16870 [Myxococcota bacterium]
MVLLVIVLAGCQGTARVDDGEDDPCPRGDKTVAIGVEDRGGALHAGEGNVIGVYVLSDAPLAEGDCAVALTEVPEGVTVEVSSVMVAFTPGKATSPALFRASVGKPASGQSELCFTATVTSDDGTQLMAREWLPVAPR